MIEAFHGFDWDDGNRETCRTHGVTTAAIESLFGRPLAVLPDEAHSDVENRLKAIGCTDENRFVLIVFTIRHRRGEVLIRPISARYMHKKEVAHYEKAIAEIE